MSELLPLLPGTLSPNACFASEQQRLVAFAENLQAVLNSGLAFYNFGSSKPDPENNGYPWLRTTDMRWYFYNGGWVTPVNYDANERRIWVGDLTQLQTYDGGDSGTPSDRSGPMWVEDENFRGKFPVGAGTLPNGTVIGPNATGGSDEATLVTANLPLIQQLQESMTQPPTADNFFSNDWAVDVDNDQPWVRKFNIGQATPDPITVVPPYWGIYVVKWSGRLYRFIP